jgi:hypothetical protein
MDVYFSSNIWHPEAAIAVTLFSFRLLLTLGESYQISVTNS